MVRVASKEYIPSKEKTVAYRYKIYRPSTDQVEELPDIPVLKIPKQHTPSHKGEHMEELLLWPLFICYKLYDHEGRQLDVEDTHAIMRMVFHGYEYPIEVGVLETFDKSNHRATIALEAKAQNKDFTVPWRERVDRWYKELQDKDPEVKDKAEELSGFKGRPGYVPALTKHNSRKSSDIIHFRLDQHSFIYGVHHWCRDKNGKTLDDETMLQIIVSHYNWHKVTSLEQRMLRGEYVSDNRNITNGIAVYAESRKDFFERKVFEAQRRYKESISKRSNDTIERVTQSMETSTLKASHPARNESIKASSRRQTRGQDFQAAAQYPSRHKAEATAGPNEYHHTEDPNFYRRRHEKEARELLAPPRPEPRPNLDNPYSYPPLPPHPQPSDPRSNVEPTQSRNEEPSQGDSGEREKKRSGGNSSSSSPPSKPKKSEQRKNKKQKRLSYDPTGNGYEKQKRLPYDPTRGGNGHQYDA